MKKNLNSGITLIALVVMLNSLLILTGVSFAMLTGQNGIITRANMTSEKTKIAEAKEHVMLTINELISEFYEEKYGNNHTFASTEDTPEKYVAAHIGDANRLDPRYASATGTTITLTEKNPNDSANYITGEYSTTDGKITWSYE